MTRKKSTKKVPDENEAVFIMKPPPVKESVDYKSELNNEQYRAVMHVKGPALVIAGAGSGKTRMLTYRVAYLIDRGVNPRNIMLVTFTKKAAAEMIKRVEEITGGENRGLIAGTFHSVANRFLRKYAKQIDFANNFTILDQGDSVQLMKRVLGSFLEGMEKNEQKRYPRPREMQNIYSRSMNLHMQIKEVIDKFYPDYGDLLKDIEHMLKLYFDIKRRNQVMDFDDLLVYFLRILRTDGIKKNIFNQVHHILVDEYQDVNQLQADIVIEIGLRAKSIMVVGDDAQSIYSFRGASMEHMMDFEDVFNTKVKKYFLTKNYRSTPQILHIANESIKHNKHQFKKELKTTRGEGPKPEVVPCSDDDEQANFVCQRILQARQEGIPLSEQAVLFRSAYQSLILEKTLLNYNIPYEKRAGLRFYETAHMKDLLSFGFLLQNPNYEIPWARIIELIPGMGIKTAERVIQVLFKEPNPLDAFVHRNLRDLFKGKRVQSKSYEYLQKMQDAFKKVAIDKKSGSMRAASDIKRPDYFFEEFLEFYKPLLELKYKENHDDRYLDLKEFLNIARGYENLSRLIEEVAISETFIGESVVEGNPEEEKEQPLILSTIHQAKGLEWDIVYIIGVAETLLPHARSMESEKEIEEERRLFYVASTRARDQLIMSYATSKWTYAGNQIMCRSSFLDEVEDSDAFKVTRLYYGVSSFEDLV